MRLNRHHRLVEFCLNGMLYLIRQLGAFTGEKLDTVIGIGIMGCADDNAGAGMQGARQVGNCRCRHRSKQAHINTGRR